MTLGDTGERRNAVLLVELCPFRWKAKPTQMNKGDNESGFSIGLSVRLRSLARRVVPFPVLESHMPAFCGAGRCLFGFGFGVCSDQTGQQQLQLWSYLFIFLRTEAHSTLAIFSSRPSHLVPSAHVQGSPAM